MRLSLLHFFLTSTLVTHDLKIVIKLINYMQSNEEFRSHFDRKYVLKVMLCVVFSSINLWIFFQLFQQRIFFRFGQGFVSFNNFLQFSRFTISMNKFYDSKNNGIYRINSCKNKLALCRGLTSIIFSLIIIQLKNMLDIDRL